MRTTRFPNTLPRKLVSWNTTTIHLRLVNTKVTIHPEFFGTVPNFEGLSRKNTRSFGMLNCPEFRTVPNLSWFNVKVCQALSSWWKCTWSFWRFCLSEMRSVELKNTPNPFLAGALLTTLPQTSCAAPLHTSPPSTLDLGISKTVPNFYNRFMVTLVNTNRKTNVL